MTRPRATGGEPNSYTTISNMEYAPGFNGMESNEYGFVNGNLVSGGIKVRSKDEAVALAEELLDWEWGKPDL